MDIKGKSAMVIGGAGGIGTDLCRRLLKLNISNLAVVDCADRKDEIEKLLGAEFPGQHIVYIRTDIAQLGELETAFKLAAAEFGGPLDLVVNTAGIFNDRDVNATLTVNAGGAINATILAVKQMHKETGGNGGCVVNISSVVGLDPLFLLPVYSASKGAIVAFTRAFSDDYYFKRTGVRILCICPGGTLTRFLEDFPKKMIYPDEEAALRFFNDFPKQTVENLNKHIINAVAKADNGSVWLCDQNVMKQATFPKHWHQV